MTNREKFKEVFGKDIKWSKAIEPQMLALKSSQINGIDCMEEWLNAEYKEPIEKCIWIKYDYRTMCPKEHDVDNPYWRIPENRMEALKYCPYCGKEIEVEE